MSNRTWPVHAFKAWRIGKALSLDEVSRRLTSFGVCLKPRSVQAIEYGFRRPEASDCFGFERLTEKKVSAEYFATFPLRPRSEKPKKRKRAA